MLKVTWVVDVKICDDRDTLCGSKTKCALAGE